jgi:transposase-like protein
MSKSCNKIPSEIKSQILSELQVHGCIVSKLAKSYNVSNTTIYTWQRQAQEIRVDKVSEIDRGGNFVELSVKDSKNSTLEKASLTFNDFSLVIEGRVKSSSLFAIVKILEEQSC